MSVEIETFRMLYEIDPTGAIPRAQKEVERYEQRLELLRQVGTSTGLSFEELERRIRVQGTAYAEASRRLEMFEAVAARAGKSGGLAAGQLKGLASGAQTLGYAFQDLVQGGFGAILNNLDRMGTALAGLLGKSAAFGAALGGALTVIGTTIYLVGPKVTQFFSDLVLGSNKVPQATEPLERMTEALGKMKKEFDDLKDKPSLTNRELATFLDLRGKIAAEEERIAAARERQAAARTLEAIRPDEESERGRIIKAGLTANDPGAQRTVAAIAAGMHREESGGLAGVEKEFWAIFDGAKGREFTPEEKARAADLRQDIDRLRPRVRGGPGGYIARNEAAKLLNQAMEAGPDQMGAFRRLQAMSEADPKAFGPDMLRAIQEAGPERMAAAKAEAEAKTHREAAWKAIEGARPPDEALGKIVAETTRRFQSREEARGEAEAKAGGEAAHAAGNRGRAELEASFRDDRAELDRRLADAMPRFEAQLAQLRLDNQSRSPGAAAAATEAARRRMTAQANVELQRSGLGPERAAELASGAPRAAAEGLNQQVAATQREAQVFNRQTLSNQQATQAVLAQILANQRAFRNAAAQQAMELQRLRREAMEAAPTAINRGRGS